MLTITRYLTIILLFVACSSAAPTSKTLPRSPEQAEAMKADGYLWADADIRRLYKERAIEIGELNAQWLEEGLSAEERAHRAYDIRRNARITARTMMSDPRRIELLQERDMERYGNPDGPTFEWLVEKARGKGLEGDAIYEEIIESAQRTQ